MRTSTGPARAAAERRVPSPPVSGLGRDCAVRLAMLAGALSAGVACGGSGSIGGGAEERAPYWDDPAVVALPDRAPPGQIPASERLLDPLALSAIDLLVPPGSWDALWLAPRAYVPAGFGIGPDYVPEIGLRLKGFLGSYRELSGKAAFRLSFDAFVPGRELAGLEGLTLNNMVQDPSALHEWAGYQFLAALGLPVPRTSHAEVRLNGEPWGLYAVIEPEDDGFLARTFDDPDGRLYDVVWFDDFTAESVWGFALDEGEEGDRQDLLAVAEAAARPLGPGWVEALDAVLDVDALVTMMAGDTVLGHWDGYGWNRNNFRVYCDRSPRCTVLPWGIDQTFGDMLPPLDQRGGLLTDLCLSDPACRTRYLLALQRAADAFEALPLRPRVEERAARIRPAVARDPRKESDLATFDAYVAGMLEVIDARPTQVRTWLAER